jgi:hypothetical protein
MAKNKSNETSTFKNSVNNGVFKAKTSVNNSVSRKQSIGFQGIKMSNGSSSHISRKGKKLISNNALNNLVPGNRSALSKDSKKVEIPNMPISNSPGDKNRTSTNF